MNKTPNCVILLVRATKAMAAMAAMRRKAMAGSMAVMERRKAGITIITGITTITGIIIRKAAIMEARAKA